MERKGKRKKIRIALIGAGLLALCVVIGSMLAMKMETEQVRALTIGELELSQTADGIYTGSAETMLVSAKVEVSVENHEIQSVKILEHQTGKGKPAEAIVDEIARQDSLDVDAVAGATYSSKVIRYAVYDALQKGKS